MNRHAAFDLRFAWGEAGRSRLGHGADVVVVVDVFSFCTCVDAAVGRGATVVPWAADHRFAAEWADRHGAVLAASERAADRPSLSPCSLTELAAGTQLVLGSPNGAQVAQVAGSTGALVFAGCIRNTSAVAAAVESIATRPLLVVAAGERWPDGSLRPALEDLVAAGSILARLSGRLSPEAAAAVAVSRDASVHAALPCCESARELIDRGFADDVRFALDPDSSEAVPVIRHPDRFFAAF